MATVLPRELVVFILFLLSAIALSHDGFETTEAPSGEPLAACISNEQIDNILGALIGSQDFFAWADVLRGADPSEIPFSATFFIPTDGAVSSAVFFSNSSSLIISQESLRYHIVPHQFAFQDLLSLTVGTRLPTLLPDHTIVVTNNTRTNFTIDDSRIVLSDLYYNGAISVHGVSWLLNYTKFGVETEFQPATKRPRAFHGSDRVPRASSLPSAREDLSFWVVCAVVAGWLLRISCCLGR